MALVVEDGTGLATAEAPGSVAELLAYFAKVGTAAQISRLAAASSVVGTAAGWTLASDAPAGATALSLAGGSGNFASGDLVAIGAVPALYEVTAWGGGVATIATPGLLASALAGAAVEARANYAEIERAGRRASRKLEALYRGRVRGSQVHPGQALAFPRSALPYGAAIEGGVTWSLHDPEGGDTVVVRPDEVPVRWMQAWAELTFLALDADLEPTLDRDDYVRSAAGSTSIMSASGTTATTYHRGARIAPVFQVVDALCAPFLFDAGRCIRA